MPRLDIRDIPPSNLHPVHSPGLRVEGGGQGGDRSWRPLHRRGPHVGYRVLLFPQQGPGGRPGPRGCHGHQQRSVFSLEVNIVI